MSFAERGLIFVGASGYNLDGNSRELLFRQVHYSEVSTLETIDVGYLDPEYAWTVVDIARSPIADDGYAVLFRGTKLVSTVFITASHRLSVVKRFDNTDAISWTYTVPWAESDYADLKKIAISGYNSDVVCVGGGNTNFQGSIIIGSDGAYKSRFRSSKDVQVRTSTGDIYVIDNTSYGTAALRMYNYLGVQQWSTGLSGTLNFVGLVLRQTDGYIWVLRDTMLYMVTDLGVINAGWGMITNGSYYAHKPTDMSLSSTSVLFSTAESAMASDNNRRIRKFTTSGGIYSHYAPTDTVPIQICTNNGMYRVILDLPYTESGYPAGEFPWERSVPIITLTRYNSSISPLNQHVVPFRPTAIVGESITEALIGADNADPRPSIEYRSLPESGSGSVTSGIIGTRHWRIQDASYPNASNPDLTTAKFAYKYVCGCYSSTNDVVYVLGQQNTSTWQLLQIDSTGTETFLFTFSHSINAREIVYSPIDNTIIVLGTVWGLGTIIKYTLSGTIVWSYGVTFSRSNEHYIVLDREDGSIYISSLYSTAVSYAEPNDTESYTIRKIDIDKNFIWGSTVKCGRGAIDYKNGHFIAPDNTSSTVKYVRLNAATGAVVTTVSLADTGVATAAAVSEKNSDVFIGTTRSLYLYDKNDTQIWRDAITGAPNRKVKFAFFDLNDQSIFIMRQATSESLLPLHTCTVIDNATGAVLYEEPMAKHVQSFSLVTETKVYLEPYDLNVDNITANSAQVNWNWGPEDWDWDTGS